MPIIFNSNMMPYSIAQKCIDQLRKDCFTDVASLITSLKNEYGQRLDCEGADVELLYLTYELLFTDINEEDLRNLAIFLGITSFADQRTLPLTSFFNSAAIAVAMKLLPEHKKYRLPMKKEQLADNSDFSQFLIKIQKQEANQNKWNEYFVKDPQNNFEIQKIYDAKQALITCAKEYKRDLEKDITKIYFDYGLTLPRFGLGKGINIGLLVAKKNEFDQYPKLQKALHNHYEINQWIKKPIISSFQNTLSKIKETASETSSWKIFIQKLAVLFPALTKLSFFKNSSLQVFEQKVKPQLDVVSPLNC